jgi:hypothetical protein
MPLKGSTARIVCIAHLDYRQAESTAVCDAFTAQQFYRAAGDDGESADAASLDSDR